MPGKNINWRLNLHIFLIAHLLFMSLNFSNLK